MASPIKRPQIHRLSNGEAVALHAAQRFVEVGTAAISRRGRFSVALAGGSTPRRLYQRLAEPRFRQQIDWERVDIFFGDERCVPPNHSESNFNMAKEALLDRVPLLPNRVHRMVGERGDLLGAAQRYQEALATALGVSPDQGPPALDLIVLGIGTDAHTASLFPHTSAVTEKERWVVVNRVPAEVPERLTFTTPLINRADNIMFLVVGGEKARALADILEGAVNPDHLPAQLIKPETGCVLWVVDEAAAALLRDCSI